MAFGRGCDNHDGAGPHCTATARQQVDLECLRARGELLPGGDVEELVGDGAGWRVESRDQWHKAAISGSSVYLLLQLGVEQGQWLMTRQPWLRR